MTSTTKNKQHLRVAIITQARMGSTRLPGKHLLEIMGKPLFTYFIGRLQKIKLADAIILATTLKPQDDILVELAQILKIACFRGSEDDVLDRFFHAVQAYKVDVIVRISADCPLIDPQLVDQGIAFFLDNYPRFDYVSNCLERTYPRGMDFEIFSTSSFNKVAAEAVQQEEREHVTPYYYRHPDLFQLKNLKEPHDHSDYRWTVDTPEDFKLISTILEKIYPKNPDFTLNDLLKLCGKYPEWRQINAHIKQKQITEQ